MSSKKARRKARRKWGQMQRNYEINSKRKPESQVNQAAPIMMVPALLERMLPMVRMNTLPAVISKPKVINPELDVKTVEQVPVDLTKDRFTLGELLSLDSDNIPFLVQTLLPEQAITVLAGQSDVGKGLFFLQLTLQIIQGKTEFLGYKLNQKFNRVILVSSEDGALQISNRIKKQLKGKSLPKEFHKRMVTLIGSHDTAKKVEAELKQGKYDLVVLDALGDLLDGDSNNLGDARRYLGQFSELIHKYGCTFLIVHHIGKGKEKQQANKAQLLGSVGIEGKARQVLMITKTEAQSHIREVKAVKANYLSDEEKKKVIKIVLEPASLTYKRVIGDIKSVEVSTEKIVPKKPASRSKTEWVATAWKMRNKGATLPEIAKVVGRNKSSVSRQLSKLKRYDTSKVKVP